MEWLPYIEKYEINEYGEMRNSITGRVLKPKSNYKGYKAYGVSIKGKYLDISIHRAVAELFVPNPENKPEVNHIDGEKSNNHYQNLEWVTPKENMGHAIKEGLRKPKYIPVEQRDMSGRYIRDFDSIAEAAKSVKVSTVSINSASTRIIECCKGKRNSYKGYKWVYKK